MNRSCCRVPVAIYGDHRQIFFECQAAWRLINLYLLLLLLQNLLKHKIFILNSSCLGTTLGSSNIQIWRDSMLCLSRSSSRHILSIMQDFSRETTLNKFPSLVRCALNGWVLCSCSSTTMCLVMGWARRMVAAFGAMADWLLLNWLSNRERRCWRSLRLCTCIGACIDHKVIYLLWNWNLSRRNSCAEVTNRGSYLSIHQICSIGSTCLLGPTTALSYCVSFLSGTSRSSSFRRIQI